MAWFEDSQQAIDARVAGLEEDPEITWEDPDAPPEEDSDLCPSTPSTPRNGDVSEDIAADEQPLPQTPLPPVEQPDVSTPPGSPVINADAPPAPASPAAAAIFTAAPSSPAPQEAAQPLPAPAGDKVAGADAASKLPTGLRWYAQATIVMCVVLPPLGAIATGLAVDGVRSWIGSKLRC